MLMLVRCCGRPPSDYFFSVLVIDLMGVVDVSVLAFFFVKEATSRMSKVLVCTSSTAHSSFSPHMLHLCGVSLMVFSARIP